MKYPNKFIRQIWRPGNPAWVDQNHFMEEMKYEGVDRVMNLVSIAEVLRCTVDSVDRIIYRMMGGDAHETGN